jgi:hypothetical protein
MGKTPPAKSKVSGSFSRAHRVFSLFYRLSRIANRSKMSPGFPNPTTNPTHKVQIRAAALK